MNVEYFVIFLISFLIGAIPFGFILAKVFAHQDLRQVGSGNTGAANLSRVSKLLAIVGVILDALKVLIAYWTISSFIFVDDFEKMIIAGAGVLGHCYSPYLRFKGGKGIATAFGAIFLFEPQISVAALGIYILIVAITRISSLSNLFASLSAPIWAWIFTHNMLLVYLLTVFALFIWIRHLENIKRLFSGTEPKLQPKSIFALILGAIFFSVLWFLFARIVALH
ncbi:MAG: glycerol-3-phosphate 1-O-acyltransferase PlsY [Deltaproteobacteria bacterium]|jgi:glycerol-3-phosphate acyltransferase PlsY|nr:glycerol-3-phosphate 1-O-acyltransferase PlsY [Deltaproteobacteria bacterium]